MKLPLGIQTFSEIRRRRLVYVDKTDYVHQLAHQYKFAFLSRPRRFGKSLILSTLESYFRGERALFEGLKLERLESEWKQYPVVRLDLSRTNYSQPGQLRSTLPAMVEGVATALGVEIEGKAEAGAMLGGLFTKLREQGKLVVLIDEYDKPLVNVLHDPELFVENRKLLSEFYSVLKSFDADIRFVMLTGISRFAKLGVFSGLNNLYDVSLEADFTGIVGFTQEEMEENFAPYIENLRTAYRLTHAEMIDALREWYNGYSWDGETRYYNPHSLLNVFQSRKLDNYWIRSATPTFFYDYLLREKLPPEVFTDPKTEDLVGYTRADGSVPLLPLLFQTGYLTIDRIERLGFDDFYHLRYPNQEVTRSFSTVTAAAYKQADISAVGATGSELKRALYAHDLPRFYRVLQGYFADIPARLHIESERYYHSMTYFLFRMLDMRMLLEKEQSHGRLDAALELPEHVYIFEFKHETTQRRRKPETLSKKALEQIHTAGYARAYLGDERPVTLVGLGFSDKIIHGRHEFFNKAGND